MPIPGFVDTFRLPAAAAPAVAQPAAAAQTASQLKEAPTPALPSVQAAPVKLPMLLGAERVKPAPAYDEYLGKLEPLIQKELAALKAQMGERGLSASDVSMVYAIDITGRETSVCLACGREGHDYQPTKVRKENPEVDSLQESLIIFQEVAARAGIRYGLIAYDDYGVLPLRPVMTGSDQGERAVQSERFRAFRKRFVTPDIADPVWLAAEAKVWKPTDASRVVKNEPADASVMGEIQNMLANAGAAAHLRGAVVAKGQVPKTNLRVLEAQAKGKGIKLSGIAIGKFAADIQKSFFSKTAKANDKHELKDHLGSSMRALIDQASSKGT